MGSKFWLSDEDKAMVERVVGSAASENFAWLASNNVLSEFSPSGGDLGVQQAVCEIVEGSDWTYAIYWHVSKSKSGKSALIWGDGHCREPKEGEGEESSRSGPISISFSPKVEDDSVYSWESYDLQTVGGGAQIYGNSSNGHRSDESEGKLLSQSIISNTEQAIQTHTRWVLHKIHAIQTQDGAAQQ